MTPKNLILKFMDNGIISEVHSGIQSLRKESGAEFLYTMNGHKIPLDNLLSVDGQGWS